jgi:hypothetical protein
MKTQKKSSTIACSEENFVPFLSRVTADAKDSKELCSDVFKGFYEYSERLRIHGMPESDGEPALKPFISLHPQDMKSTQTVSKQGGNCKMKH